MSAAVSITPAAPVSKVSACRIDVTGADLNDATAYNAGTIPTEPELRYYLRLRKAGVDDLKSETFAPSTDGKHSWYTVTIPASGTWTLTLRKASDDSQVATASVVVS